MVACHTRILTWVHQETCAPATTYEFTWAMSSLCMYINAEPRVQVPPIFLGKQRKITTWNCIYCIMTANNILFSFFQRNSTCYMYSCLMYKFSYFHGNLLNSSLYILTSSYVINRRCNLEQATSITCQVHHCFRHHYFCSCNNNSNQDKTPIDMTWVRTAIFMHDVFQLHRRT